MRIGIDISILQTAHRKRGIGYTLINFLNHLPDAAKKEHDFVFYHYPVSTPDNDPMPLLDLQGVSYTTVTIQPHNIKPYHLPGKLRLLAKVLNYVAARQYIRSGDSRIVDTSELDWFLQFDQNQPLPNGVRTGLVIYDLIQFIIESDYLWGYRTARSKGRSRKRALLHHFKRRRYMATIQQIINQADLLFAISEQTKKDFIRYTDVDPSKIVVSLLSPDDLPPEKQQPDHTDLKQYVHSSWGYFPQPLSLKNKKFLLFVGGADPRRKLTDLVAAFNNLRAQGEDIKLVMAGDTMLGAFAVPHEELQKYLQHTSYLDDIHFVGFVTDSQKAWLYQHATAFVYPTVYEGFGLPVLEAMQYGTPVITYNNSSVAEVSGHAALYADNALTIAQQAKALLHDPALHETYAKRGPKQAAKFSWFKTASTILENLK